MKKIAILGSTGSIGTQTLEVVRENGDIQVLGLAAGNNIKLLEEQIREFSPKLVAVWSEEKAAELRQFSEIGVQRFFLQNREKEEEEAELIKIVQETQNEME